MSVKTGDQTSDRLDTIKWLVVILLLGSGLASFYYFDEQSLLVRVVSLLLVAMVAAWIASKTGKGRYAIDFIREANLEVRRVVWPTRQETLQMTAVVLLMVVLVALFIWILDSILMWIVRLLTGQGG